MTLDEEHPKAFIHFTTDDGFMKGSGQPSECVDCDRPTVWLRKDADLHVCSRRCYQNHAARLQKLAN